MVTAVARIVSIVLLILVTVCSTLKRAYVAAFFVGDALEVLFLAINLARSFDRDG